MTPNPVSARSTKNFKLRLVLALILALASLALLLSPSRLVRAFHETSKGSQTKAARTSNMVKPLAVSGSTITVTSGADSGAGTLRQAVISAASGDTIQFGAGVSTVTLTSGEIFIDKSLTIQGPGASSLTIKRDSNASNFRIFEVQCGSGAHCATLVISDLTISGGNSNDGGAILAQNGPTITVNNSILSGNHAGSGGAISGSASTVNINSSTLSGNSADGGGGALVGGANFGVPMVATIANSTLSGNTAGGGGGAVLGVSSSITVNNSTLSGNSSRGSDGGGAIWGFCSFGNGSVTITNSTLSGNSAAGDGGGLRVTGQGGGATNTVIINNSTFTNNVADNGGGIGMFAFAGSTNITLNSSIVANNVVSNCGPDICGDINAGDYNLIKSTSGISILPGSHNITGKDPLLGPLQNNGGPTRTHALLGGSPAIDQGKNVTSLPTDQRLSGFSRTFNDAGVANAAGGDATDIGAFEAQSHVNPSPSPSPACATPPSGLISWWTGDTDAKDLQANNDGTLQNGATAGVATGEVGKAFNFAAANSQYVSIPDSPSLRPSALTIDAWVNFNSTVGGGCCNTIFSKGFSINSDDSYILYYSGNALHATISDGSTGSTSLNYPWTPTPGTWYHIAYTFDGTLHFLYVDGQVVKGGVNTRVPAYDTTPVLIGGDTDHGGLFPFDGKMDEVEFFNRALSSSEVASIFKAGSLGKCKPAPSPSPSPSPSPTATPALPHITVFGKTGPTSAGGSITFNATTDAGLNVRVQSTTTPNSEGSWTTLSDGGQMNGDGQGHYSLTTTAYPITDGLYFRALSSKTNFTDGKSDPIGPFDLKTLPRIASMSFNAPTTPGGSAIFSVSNYYSGVTVRVQSSTSTSCVPGNPPTCPEASWSDLADNNNGHLVESTPGNYSLSTTHYPNANGVFFRLLSSKNGFNDGKSDAFGPYNLKYSGPSGTVLTVNGSTSPQSNLADTVLRFAVQQSGAAAGLKVRVQYFPDPNTGGWSDLPNGRAGQMTFNPTSQQYILSSLDYPRRSSVSFRAIASASGYPDSISDPVGPFDLTSSKPRLGATNLYVTGNGPRGDLDFMAKVTDLPAGLQVRIQSSFTPDDEISWTDINGSPNMKQSTLPVDSQGHPVFPNIFLLDVNNLPDKCGVYFRALASANGLVDSISNAVGPFNVTRDTPPEVAIVPLSGNKGDAHDRNNPLVVEAGNVGFLAAVCAHTTDPKICTSSKPVSVLRILADFDQGHIFEYNSPVGDGFPRYQAAFNLSLGDHIIQAFALDQVTGCNGEVLHATARAGSSPLYIRVVPQGTASAIAEFKKTGKAPAAAASGARVFHAVKDGYATDPQTWSDEFGNPGVPTSADSVRIENHTIHLNDIGGLGAASIFINGGTLMADAGTLSLVYTVGTLTINSCTVIGGVGIQISDGARGNLFDITFQDDTSLGFGLKGDLLIDGTLNIYAAKNSIALNRLTIGRTRATGHVGQYFWLDPPQVLPNVDINATVGTVAIGANQVQLNSAQIVGTRSHLLTSDGAGLITSDGAGLIGHDGGSLIGHDGGSVVSQGGGNIIAAGGGNLIGSDGAGVIAAGGGNILNNNGSNVVAAGGGNIISRNGSGFVQQGRGNMQEGRPNGAQASGSDFYVQTDGVTDLSSFTILGPVSLDGGVLTGSGMIYGDVTNYGGSISPGHSPGTIGVTGNYTQSANGRLVVEDGGKSPSQFDQLQVGGTAKLGGTLEVRLLNGYTPDPQDTFSPLAYSGMSGNFNSVTADAQATLNANGLLLKVDSSIPVATMQFSSTTYTVGEGDGKVNITVSRSGDTSGAATVDYRTTDTDTFTVGCADTVNNQHSAYGRCDFATTVGTLKFAAGETTKSFSVPVIDDAHVEGNETFNVVLSNPSGLLGPNASATVTITDNDSSSGPNPIFNTPFFVRQHYLDFLAREPEAGEPWSGVLNNCSDVNNNPACDRITVSGAFFGSPEFKDKGGYIIGFYRAAFDRLPTYPEFATGLASLTGTTAQEVFARRAVFANDFLLRSEASQYNVVSNADYVSALMGKYSLASITTPDPANPDGQNKVSLSSADLTNRLNAGTLTRGQVLRAIVQSDQVVNAEALNVFVASQYYGYLRRAPEADGFNAWKNYLTAHPTDFRTMVNGFMNSAEYRLRFGQP